jgi:hypothetical protein
VFSEDASDPRPFRLVSFSSSDPVTSEFEETMAMNLRRSHEELSSGCAAFASVGHDSTGDVAAACRKVPYEPYEAPYKAKPSMKNVNIDGQDAVFWRSARVTAGITAGGEFTSARSSREVCAIFSHKSKRNSRLGTLYRLATLFADSDEFNMRCSHRLLVEKR